MEKSIAETGVLVTDEGGRSLKEKLFAETEVSLVERGRSSKEKFAETGVPTDEERGRSSKEELIAETGVLVEEGGRSPKEKLIAETGVPLDEEGGKSPKKLLIKDIYNTLIVAQALLELSESSDLKPPDLLPPDLTSDYPDDFFLHNLFDADSLPNYIEGEIVEPYSPRVGDTVKLRSENPKFRCYVSRVDRKEGEILTCTWYYYPEETKEGRLPFHGAMEIFSSGSTTAQFVQTVIGKCNVHTLEEYSGLENGATEDDFFSRFHYDHINGVYNPEATEV